MADAYLKVKDNGANGLAIVREESDVSVADLKSALNYNKTATPGYVLRASNSGNGSSWEAPGTPTDEQVQEVVDDWMDAHSGQYVVPDESLSYKKLIPGTLGFVTPEMFGAKGDGVTDDSAALSGAMNSGLPVLCNSNAEYYIGTAITIYDKNVIIDFNGCILKMGAPIEFNGRAVNIGDYEYSASDKYITAGAAIKNGIFHIISETEKWSDSRADYVLGFASRLSENGLEFPFPYDVSGTAVIYAEMQVRLENIGDIIIADGYTSDLFRFNGVTVDLENININKYKDTTVFTFQICHLTAKNIALRSDRVNSSGFSYGFKICCCSGFALDRVYTTSVWHGVTTGGNKGVSFNGIVTNSVFRKYAADSQRPYCDHENAFNTTFVNCAMDALITCGGKLIDCDVGQFQAFFNNKETYKQKCELIRCNVKREIIGRIHHVEFDDTIYYYDSIVFRDCVIDLKAGAIAISSVSNYQRLCDILKFVNCKFINLTSSAVLFADNNNNVKLNYKTIDLENIDFGSFRPIYVKLTDATGLVANVNYRDCKMTVIYVYGGNTIAKNCHLTTNGNTDSTATAVLIDCIIANGNHNNATAVHCVNGQYEDVK